MMKIIFYNGDLDPEHQIRFQDTAKGVTLAHLGPEALALLDAAPFNVPLVYQAAGRSQARIVRAVYGFDLRLTEHPPLGTVKIAVIKVVRILIGSDLKNAKALVDKAPCVILGNLSKEDAEKAKANLEAAGACVELLPSADPKTSDPVPAPGEPAAKQKTPAKQETPQGPRFDLRLDDAGLKKIAVIKQVRALTGLNLKESKELTEQAPVVIKESLLEEDAQRAMGPFRELGATITLVPCTN